MICEKKQGAEDAKAHHSRENCGVSWIVFSVFFGICQIKKKKKNQRKSSTLKHAEVDNNKFFKSK